ncbi:AAA family ATPase [Ferruginibacter yonginensis]|uniref:AAA family ATPase n=1 Tax=Ferruginibacter yonginensis TaxID=1310416 RepID=A0ABV8QQ80_9BACT
MQSNSTNNTIDVQLKQKVVEAIINSKQNFSGSDSKHAKSLNINSAVYSQIKAGKLDGNLLSKGEWIRLARELEVPIGNEIVWKTANTSVYQTISAQMKFCKENSQCAVFCDDADLGKTHTAKDFAKRNLNTVYQDCSQTKTKQLLVRTIAESFGLDSVGKYIDVKNNLVYYLKTLEQPMIILDEFGDLNYDAFLEIKALWNATEGACAWYALGADGLKVKIERGRNCKKVGYTEFFSRFGKKYQHVVPMGKDDKEAFYLQLVATVLKANLPAGVDVQKVTKSCNNSLRRAKMEVIKIAQRNG